MMHDPIDDPDIAQAIEDFRETALELRDLSLAVANAPPVPEDRADDRRRARDEQRIAEILSEMTVRAERIGLTADELLAHLNADLAERSRQSSPIQARTALRILTDAVTERIEAEAVAHLELSEAQDKMRLATAARIAAEVAYTKYTAARRDTSERAQ